MKSLKEYLNESIGTINKEHEFLSLKDVQNNNEVIKKFNELKPNTKETINLSYPGVNFEFNIETKGVKLQ